MALSRRSINALRRKALRQAASRPLGDGMDHITRPPAGQPPLAQRLQQALEAHAHRPPSDWDELERKAAAALAELEQAVERRGGWPAMPKGAAAWTSAAGWQRLRAAAQRMRDRHEQAQGDDGE